MTAGLATTNGANTMLGALPSTVYVALHTGDPGSAGTSNASSETTRKSMTLAAASGGSRAASTDPEWDTWSAGSETLSHISLWSASTAGNFIASVALTSSVAIANGDDFILDSYSIALSPLAA